MDNLVNKYVRPSFVRRIFFGIKIRKKKSKLIPKIYCDVGGTGAVQVDRVAAASFELAPGRPSFGYGDGDGEV